MYLKVKDFNFSQNLFPKKISLSMFFSYEIEQIKLDFKKIHLLLIQMTETKEFPKKQQYLIDVIFQVIFISILQYIRHNKIIMNPEQCWNHPLNRSRSKYAFKFSKSNRFKDPVLLTHTIYKVESRYDKKGCGFGFGDRPGLAKKAQTPSPQIYNLPSSISKKAKTFGSSRKNTIFRWFLQGATKNADRPGPDAYRMPSSLQGRKYSLGARLPTDIDINLRKRGPAPNNYNLQSAGSPASGKYASSQYKNARKIIFFGRQTPAEKSLNVGPGSYNIAHNYESLDDKQFRQTFGSSDRPGPADKSKKNFPGPGLYETFSQFPSQVINS